MSMMQMKYVYCVWCREPVVLEDTEDTIVYQIIGGKQLVYFHNSCHIEMQVMGLVVDR